MAKSASSKRAISAVSAREPAAKRSKPSSAPSADAELKGNRSRLLDLPTEIFDMILELEAVRAGAYLNRRSSSLRSASSLMLVSRHVRNQYLNVLNASASPIRTTVQNFNFSHIVTFLNRLSERELKSLPTVALPTERKFIIKLTPTQATNPEQLHRWLLRLEHPKKKGTAISADYIVPIEVGDTHIRYAHDVQLHGYDRMWPVLKSLNKWKLKLEDGRSLTQSYLVLSLQVAVEF